MWHTCKSWPSPPGTTCWTFCKSSEAFGLHNKLQINLHIFMIFSALIKWFSKFGPWSIAGKPLFLLLFCYCTGNINCNTCLAEAWGFIWANPKIPMSIHCGGQNTGRKQRHHSQKQTKVKPGNNTRWTGTKKKGFGLTIQVHDKTSQREKQIKD